jgi:hypothetical protein
MLGYPSERQLKTIRNWPIKDPQDIRELHKIMEYIKPIWEFGNFGYWNRIGDVYYISTAGWSGNESIIEALEENIIFWMLYFYQMQRGGHYIFCKDFVEEDDEQDS